MAACLAMLTRAWRGTCCLAPWRPCWRHGRAGDADDGMLTRAWRGPQRKTSTSATSSSSTARCARLTMPRCSGIRPSQGAQAHARSSRHGPAWSRHAHAILPRHGTVTARVRTCRMHHTETRCCSACLALPLPLYLSLSLPPPLSISHACDAAPRSRQVQRSRS